MTGMAQANIRDQLRQMYRIYKLISDNAHGNIKGLTGSLTSSCLLDVLNALHVTGQGRRIFDCGAADGKVLAAALILGSEGAHGFELPENAANRFIFQSVLNRIVPVRFESTCTSTYPSAVHRYFKCELMFCIFRIYIILKPFWCRSGLSLMVLQVFILFGLAWSTLIKSKFFVFVQPVIRLMEWRFSETENGNHLKKVFYLIWFSFGSVSDIS